MRIIKSHYSQCNPDRFLSSPPTFPLHAATAPFLCGGRDAPELINCHPPFLSAIRKAGKWLLFPPVSCLIPPRLQQLVKSTFYALSFGFYLDRLTISADGGMSRHGWIPGMLHQVIRRPQCVVLRYANRLILQHT